MTDVSTSLVEPDYGPRTTADYGLRPGCKIDAGCKSNLKTHSKKSSYEKRLESKLRRKYILNLFSEPQHLAKSKRTMSMSVFQCQGQSSLTGLANL